MPSPGGSIYAKTIIPDGVYELLSNIIEWGTIFSVSAFNWNIRRDIVVASAGIPKR